LALHRVRMAGVLLWLYGIPCMLFGIACVADVGENNGENWYSRPSELVSPRRE